MTPEEEKAFRDWLLLMINKLGAIVGVPRIDKWVTRQYHAQCSADECANQLRTKVALRKLI